MSTEDKKKWTVVTKGYGSYTRYEVVNEKGHIKNPYPFSTYREADDWRKENES